MARTTAAPRGDPQSPHRVSFNPNHTRRPREDELSVMRTFSNHARRCSQCADPYRVWQEDRQLCDVGHMYARDVAKYIYSKGGRPISVVDRDNYGDRNEVEIPTDCEVVRKLVKAFDKGLSLRSRKPVVYSQDSNYFVKERRPPSPEHRSRESKAYDSRYGYGVEITPGVTSSSRKERERYTEEERRAKERRRQSMHSGDYRGSLYDLDEKAKKDRRRYDEEPVIIVAEPRRRYRA